MKKTMLGRPLGELARETLLRRTSAGRRAAYDAGRVPRAPADGYKAEPGPAGCHGPSPEAAVVVEIFEMVRAGKAPAEIAKHLGRQHPSPGTRASRNPEATGTWSAAAVRRIVRSPLYTGHVVFGMTRSVREPSSATTLRHGLPSTEWARVYIPRMRIVASELWELANRMLDARRPQGGTKRRPGKKAEGRD